MFDLSIGGILQVRQCWVSNLRDGISLRIFFFNDTATTEIYTLSLHDALPIYLECRLRRSTTKTRVLVMVSKFEHRSEEHTSELQSHSDLVCRLLLEKKKK